MNSTTGAVFYVNNYERLSHCKRAMFNVQHGYGMRSGLNADARLWYGSKSIGRGIGTISTPMLLYAHK